MPDYKQLYVELVNELHGYKVAHPNHDTDLIDRARAAEPETELGKPVVGELVVVAHRGDFDYPMDAVQLGRLRETREHDGKTYYYVDDLRRGFRHCRTLTPRVLPIILSPHD